ncbi:MAG TPA: AMP-binding protein, partial [Acidimicrobiales bacterium]|nr:AMP-binding protein [Acidimicrobiales bacterium]
LGDLDLDAVVAAAVGGGNRFLPNAPFMHGAAQWIAMRQLLGGGAVVVNAVVDRLDPVEVWTTLERERCDCTLMVGEAFVRPLVTELERGRYDASSLRLVVVGGAVTSPESKARLLHALPDAIVLDAAGASETGTGLSAVSTRGSTTEAGVFAATPHIAVLDAELQRRLTPGDDQTGWFAKRGAIPLGYLGDRAKTERTFPVVDGERWSVPGDRARWRADGRVELLGRDSVTINTGGEKVFAEEVEAAVLTCPGIADAIVVGRPSPQWGQEVVAIVELDGTAATGAQAPPVTDEAILAAAEARVARYKLPKAIIRVDRITRSPAGKADYRWAAEIAAQR